MRGRWGRMTWLVTAIWLASLVLIPLPALAADFGGSTWGSRSLSFQPIEAKTSLEAQMLGEKPSQTNPSWPGKSLFEAATGLTIDQDGAAIKLPKNLELRISFLYDGNRAALQAERPVNSYLLFKYSMDYRILPNLQVGLSGFLYQPGIDALDAQRRFGYGGMAMGLGPGIKYDLGRWSFTLKSQLATGSRDRGEGGPGMENWFRVWYAF
jgi:hypothetical protein